MFGEADRRSFLMQVVVCLQARDAGACLDRLVWIGAVHSMPALVHRVEA